MIHTRSIPASRRLDSRALVCLKLALGRPRGSAVRRVGSGRGAPPGGRL
jgi:hypothetical protein